MSIILPNSKKTSLVPVWIILLCLYKVPFTLTQLTESYSSIFFGNKYLKLLKFGDFSNKLKIFDDQKNDCATE